MRLYTSHEGCGAHTKNIEYLKSWGVEPALEFDEEMNRHYLEFTPPKGVKRKSFIFALFKKTSSGVLCICGKWWEKNAEGEIHPFRCENCHNQFDCCSCLLEKGAKDLDCPFCVPEPPKLDW